MQQRKIEAVLDAWKEIKKFCDDNKMDSDDAYQALFASAGISIKKVFSTIAIL